MRTSRKDTETPGVKFSCDGNCAGCILSSTGLPEWRKISVLVTSSDKNLLPDTSRILRHRGYEICFRSIEKSDEIIPCSQDEKFVILDMVDTGRLEQELEFTARLLDMDLRLVVGLGGYRKFLETDHAIDYSTLATLLGVPVLPVSFADGEGLAGIADALIEAFEADAPLGKHVPFVRGESVDDMRKAFVRGALQETVIHSKDNSDHTLLQKVDSILTNKWLGLPLLALILFGVFQLTFFLGAYPQGWIESGIGALTGWMHHKLPAGWLSSMMIDGVVQGVGAVVSFLPNIILMFFFLSLLEDSGYMARAAFLMDKIMHKIGLHGKSFVPMLIGFGCNVPAIMAARSIDDKRDRTLTMLMIPFMSCSARLPVYMLFVSAFFADHKALVMMAIYVTGVVLSIIFAFLMKRTRYFRKGNDDFVSALPPFRKPTFAVTAKNIWERVSDYLQKITTVILAASVIIWALEYFPADRTNRGADKEQSCLAMVGKAISPVMEPLGFDWKMNVCLITGLPAKEAIVSTMGILYHAEGDDGTGLLEAMNEESGITPAVAIAFMLFVLLYFPCIATISTLRRETGWKWAAFTVIHSLLLAWVVAFTAMRLFSLIL